MSIPKTTAVKICGITRIDQARKIAELKVNAIGVIGVKDSPRYVDDLQRRAIFEEVRKVCPLTERVWVIANMNHSNIDEAIRYEGIPTIIQLHGQESPKDCLLLKKRYPKIKFWKALRVQFQEDMAAARTYAENVDAILLDSWDSKALGGTGRQIPLEWLCKVDFNVPWWLAGGISEDWVKTMPISIKPDGLDASSKIEISPGIKDIGKVKALINAIRE